MKSTRLALLMSCLITKNIRSLFGALNGKFSGLLSGTLSGLRRAFPIGMFSFNVGLCALSAEERKIDFNKDIRPLLSNRCYACHGPDDEHRKADLRFDTRDGAMMDLGGYKALEPGKPRESAMLYRILLPAGDEELMPPKGKGTRFTSEEAALVEKWIEQDAPYATHWSYQPPKAHPIPEVATPAWPKNSIDNFILARLESEGKSPAPQADPLSLARRVSLDLTGLPPTWEEAQAFIQEAGDALENFDQAYERYVDHLIKKTSFGERWARVWLDLARYADSAGYADDPPRTIWGYRDYVIRSLNANKPFDQFTREQLAGDLLDEPTEEHMVATAFHRNTLTNNEGGTSDEEFRNVAVVDRVNTTMAVWMGTTIDCAQCHTHKYDPLTQEEYFKLFAIFNQSEDADRRNESPIIAIMSDTQKAEKASVEKQVATKKAAFEKDSESMKADRVAWLKRVTQPATWDVITPTKAETSSGAEQLKLTIQASGTLTSDVKNEPANGNYSIRWVGPKSETMLSGIRLNVSDKQDGNIVITHASATWQPDESKPVLGRIVRIDLPGKKRIINLAEIQIFGQGKNLALTAKPKQSSTDFGGDVKRINDGMTEGNFDNILGTHTKIEDNPWIEIDLGRAMPINQIVVWNRTGAELPERLKGYKISILDTDRSPVWEKVPGDFPNPSTAFDLSGARTIPFELAVASYEQNGFPAAAVLTAKPNLKSGWAIAGGLGKAQSLSLFLAKPMSIKGGSLQLHLEQQSIHTNHLLNHFSLSQTQDEVASDLARMPKNVRALVSKPESKWSAKERDLITAHHRNISPVNAKERNELAGLEKKLAALKPINTVPVMRELPADKQRKTFVQLRGSFLNLGDEVTPGVPAVFHPLEDKAAPDRLALANWLMDDANPLTARVVANRHWEHIFGVGIVETSEEFGSQGEVPSHPELLDWLALDLRQNGWDLKRFIKQLVMSAAYQQSSVTSIAKQEEDPYNRMVSRGPRFRITAEMVRDQALAISGLLSRKMYGPPVKPPQPNSGLLAAFGSATDWQTSKGEDKYRRGIYTTWRRSNPYPSMATFDAPNREICTVRRSRTNTPLQALVTLNDPVYVEAAQAYARQLHAVKGDPTEKAAYAIQRALIRQPRAEELERIVSLYDDMLDEYAANPEDAKLMSNAKDGEPAVELAAWTIVANVILNLDEIFMKR